MSNRRALVHLTATRGQLELLKRLAQQIVPRGPSLPLTLSFAARLGLVGVAARHARTVVRADSAMAAIEFSAPDLEAALQSVRGYRFMAALRGGKAVPVRMRCLMRFQLR